MSVSRWPTASGGPAPVGRFPVLWLSGVSAGVHRCGGHRCRPGGCGRSDAVSSESDASDGDAERAADLRGLHPPEEAQGQAVYDSSIAYPMVALSDATGAGGRPGKPFGLYADEQIAESAENGEAPIVSHLASASGGLPDPHTVISLSVPRRETRGAPGVRC